MSSDLTIRPVSDAVAAAQTAALETHAFRTKSKPDAAQKFEAFVLQTFIQEMMPKEAEGVFGSGVSGDFWKSMMAEKIAEQVAERGSVGIADYVKQGDNVPSRPASPASLEVLSRLSTLNEMASPLQTDPTSGD